MSEKRTWELTHRWQAEIQRVANQRAQEAWAQINAGLGLKRGTSIETTAFTALVAAHSSLKTAALGLNDLRDHIHSYVNDQELATRELAHWVGEMRKAQKKIKELNPS